MSDTPREPVVVVVTEVLRKRPLVFAEVPFAHALCDVASALQELGERDLPVETAGFAVHRWAQQTVVQRVLPGVNRRTRWCARGGRIRGREHETLVGELVHRGSRISERRATPVEARVHPSDVVHQEDQDVRLLPEAFLECRELLLDLVGFLWVEHHGLHVRCDVGGEVRDVLVGVIVPLRGCPARRRAPSDPFLRLGRREVRPSLDHFHGHPVSNGRLPLLGASNERKRQHQTKMSIHEMPLESRLKSWKLSRLVGPRKGSEWLGS